MIASPAAKERAAEIFASMSESERASILEDCVMELRDEGSRVEIPKRWALHAPHPGPQTRFVSDDSTLEILYGGAAGGGKTDGLLMAALKYVHVPGYNAIIFRRTSPMLKQANGLILRLHEWLQGTPAKWSAVDKRWTFPSGATLTLSHLQYDTDVYDHAGAEYHFVGFEELTEFTRWQYTFLFSRLRRPSGADSDLASIPLRMRATSNPGGQGHIWVKKRFLDLDNPETAAAIKAARRAFIKATLEDNPSLDAAAYEESLRELDPVTRRRLRWGDWDTADDGLLSWELIAACRDESTLWPGPEIPRGTRDPLLYMGVDIGRTTHNTVLTTGELVGDVIYIREMKVLRHKEKPMTFGEQKAEIKRRIKAFRPVKVKIDKGGIGMQLSEELETEHPGVVEGVQLNPARQGQLSTIVENRFTQRTIRTPFDDDLDEDLQLVGKAETKNGRPIIKTDEGPSGHADRFWSIALMLFAVPIIPIRRSNAIPVGTRSQARRF